MLAGRNLFRMCCLNNHFGNVFDIFLVSSVFHIFISVFQGVSVIEPRLPRFLQVPLGRASHSEDDDLESVDPIDEDGDTESGDPNGEGEDLESGSRIVH